MHTEFATRRSKIPNAGTGLFAKRALAAGQFLGFYTGKVVARMGDGVYTMQVGQKFVNPSDDCLLRLMNEAPSEERQNVAFAEYSIGSLMTDRPYLSAAGAWAISDIPAGAELLTNYGPSYSAIRQKHGYTVGKRRRIGRNAQEPLDVGPLPLQSFAPAVLERRTVPAKRGKLKAAPARSGPTWDEGLRAWRPGRGRPPLDSVWDAGKGVYTSASHVVKE